MRHCIALILIVLFLFPAISYAAPSRACLKTATGKIVIKRRCKAKKGEQEISADTLQGLGATQVGPQGPQGATGPQGVQGNDGLQGATGPQGLPGPNVTAYTVDAHSSCESLPTDGSYGNVLSLADGSGSGPITTAFPARFLINGSAYVGNSDFSTRDLTCRLVIAPGTAEEQVIGPRSVVKLTLISGDTLSLTGVVERPAGTYDFGIQCKSTLSNIRGIFCEGGINVIAAAQ